MQNKVEYHIKRDSRLTFNVKAGQTVKIGQLVEVAGNLEVQPAAADSAKVLGVCYGGTVGKDGVTVGYLGDNKDVVTVVHNGNFIYAPVAANPAAGTLVVADAAGGYKAAGATPAANTVVGLVVSNSTKVAGQSLIYLKA